MSVLFIKAFLPTLQVLVLAFSVGAMVSDCCILYEREDICSTREANLEMVFCSNASCLSTREEVADLTELVTDCSVVSINCLTTASNSSSFFLKLVSWYSWNCLISKSLSGDYEPHVKERH